MSQVNLITQEDFDNQTYSDLKNLSKIRLSLLEERLSSIDQLIDELVARKLIEPKDIYTHKKELTNILQTKINHLKEFVSSDNLYCDELEFYIDIL